MQGVADVVEAELFGLFFQRGEQAFVEADGGAAFSADDMVMVVAGLLGKIEGFPCQNDSLEQAGFPQGLKDAVDGGAVADLRTHLRKDLFRGEGGRGLGEHVEDCPTAGSGLQARFAEWVGRLGV